MEERRGRLDAEAAAAGVVEPRFLLPEARDGAARGMGSLPAGAPPFQGDMKASTWFIVCGWLVVVCGRLVGELGGGVGVWLWVGFDRGRGGGDGLLRLGWGVPGWPGVIVIISSTFTPLLLPPAAISISRRRPARHHGWSQQHTARSCHVLLPLPPLLAR